MAAAHFHTVNTEPLPSNMEPNDTDQKQSFSVSVEVPKTTWTVAGQGPERSNHPLLHTHKKAIL